MTREEAYNQYLREVTLFEQWGSKNTTTFDEWLEIKNIKLEPEPKGLDEAAENAVITLVPTLGQQYEDGSYVNGIRDYFTREELISLFKAGAKWQAEQGITVYGDIEGNWRNQEDAPYEIFAVSDSLPMTGNIKFGDKVIVQIRKANEKEK